MRISSLAAGIVLSATIAAPALACSSCGCTLTSDWLSQGLAAVPGTTVSLRYDYIPQSQLRSGHGGVDRSAIALPPDREIELSTYNHYATLTLDHSAGPWAFNLQAPFVSRPHRTIDEDTVDPSYSRTRGLGDIRATARFQGFGGPGVTGVQFGLKLPTGRFRQTFRSGPVAGEEVDRGLQPGTGTLDIIVGAYHEGRLGGSFDFVLQGQSQIPLDHRAQYRPGVVAELSVGLRYGGWQGITPQLQLNYHVAARDRGAAADRENSGGEQLYVAPGLSAGLGKRLSGFGFVQLPLYSRVEGYQLAPRYSLSAGVQYRL